MRRVSTTGRPIYLAVADAIEIAVAAGELKPGERLPAHRVLADELGIDFTTVTRAYREARKRGLLQATVGRGTFIRSEKSLQSPDARSPEGPVDLSMNLPPLPPGSRLQDAIRQGMNWLLANADPSQLLTYRAGCGTPEERLAGARWLAPTVGEIDPRRVLVCAGAQTALAAILSTSIGEGGVVLTDHLTYPGIRAAAAQRNVRLLGVAGDAEGMLPEAIDEACRKVAAKAVYCLPTIQNPTTTTMSPERREAIARSARRNGLLILEDDAYGLLPSSPMPAIASFAPDIAIYCATVSKTITPALRIAYLAVPDAVHADRLAPALRANILMPSPLLTGLMTKWIDDGDAGAIASAIRTEAAARQQIASTVLPDGSFSAHPEGLHLWLRLPSKWDRRGFVSHLHRQAELAVVPSDAFAVDSGTSVPEAVRISLGAAADRKSLRRALDTVGAALSGEPAAAFANIV